MKHLSMDGLLLRQATVITQIFISLVNAGIASEAINPNYQRFGQVKDVEEANIGTVTLASEV